MISTMREGPEGLRVERRLLPLTRVLGAAACSVVAWRVLHFFWEPLIAYSRYSLQELKESAPGVLLIAFLFLLFAVPAWLFLFRRAGVVVSPDSTVIRDFRHYGLFGRQRAIPASTVKRIRLWRYVASSRSSATAYFRASLVLGDGREVLTANDLDPKRARGIARALGRRLGVRIEDET